MRILLRNNCFLPFSRGFCLETIVFCNFQEIFAFRGLRNAIARGFLLSEASEMLSPEDFCFPRPRKCHRPMIFYFPRPRKCHRPMIFHFPRPRKAIVRRFFTFRGLGKPSSDDFLLSEASEIPSSNDFAFQKVRTASSEDFFFPRGWKVHRPMIFAFQGIGKCIVR